MRAVIIPILAALLVGGCVTTGPASVRGGECRIFSPPGQQVWGVTVGDQIWINDQIESGVAACGWRRPTARPRPAAIVPALAVAQPVKKQRWWQRRKKVTS